MRSLLHAHTHRKNSLSFHIRKQLWETGVSDASPRGQGHGLRARPTPNRYAVLAPALCQTVQRAAGAVTNSFWTARRAGGDSAGRPMARSNRKFPIDEDTVHSRMPGEGVGSLTRAIQPCLMRLFQKAALCTDARGPNPWGPGSWDPLSDGVRWDGLKAIP